MSLNFDATAVPEDVRTIVATADEPMYGIKKGDRIQSPITKTIIFATMGVGIGVINDATVDEFAARIDLWQRLNGDLLSKWSTDEDGKDVYEGPEPLTREHIEAHKGLTTNVFPYEPRSKWVKRIVGQSDQFRTVTEPKAAQVRA